MRRGGVRRWGLGEGGECSILVLRKRPEKMKKSKDNNKKKQ